MKLYWFLSILFVFSVSCSREKSATTNIVFEIPAVQQKASADFNLLDLQEIEDDFKTNNEWSSIVPTGITEGEYPINCYVVMVSGPEAHMQESMCGRKVVTVAGSTATTGDVINPLFQFGPWVGAVYAGSGQSAQIAMDVPSGSSRVFRLVGFHALTAAACADFKNNVIDSGNLTKPYVLGVVSGINLAPGETSTVTIPQNLNAEEWFDSCKFKDVNNDPIAPQVEMIGVTKVSGQAERAVFTLGTDSPNNLIYKCELYKFYPMNRYFQSTAMNQNITMTSHTCTNEGTEPICNLDAPVAMFDDYTQCVAAVNIGQSSLYWTQNSPYIYRWIRTSKYGINSNLDRNHNMYIQARAISSSGLEFQRANPIKYLIRRNDDTHVKLFGSRSLISGGCYKMTAVYAQYNGAVQTGGILDGIDVIVDNASGPVNVAANHIYSDSACSNLSIPTSITSGYVDFYIKAPSEPKFTLKVRMNGSHLADNAESFITSRLGSNFAKYARIRGPHVMLRNACVGPFTLESVNENGSSLVVTAASSSAFKMANPSMLSAYPASDCISGAIDLYATGLSIPGGSSELKFYLKSTATPAVYDLKLTNSSGISTESREMLLYEP